MKHSSGHLAAVLRQWPLVVVLVVIGIIGGIGYTKVVTPVYTSSAQVLLAVQSNGSTTDRLAGSSYVAAAIPTYTSAVTSSVVLTPVVEELHLAGGLAAAQTAVSAASGTDTALITITATGDSAEDARDLAAAVTKRFVAVAPKVVSPVSATATPTATPTSGASAADAAALAQAQAAAGDTPAAVDLSVVDRANLPTAPVSPKKALGLVLGLIAGLIVGIAIALARFALDKRIRSEAVVEEIVGSSVIGRLPVVDARRWAERESDAVWAESVRGLRSALFTWGDPARSVQFSSATPGEGVTSTVSAVASSLARAGVRTTLVEADLRSPSLASAFGLEGSTGLADVLTGSASIADVSGVPDGLASLTVVPAGSTDAAGDLVASDVLRRVLSATTDDADIVLVDTPSLLTAGDALAVAHAVTGVVLVVRLGGVTEQVLRRTVEQLTAGGRTIAGIVVTGAPRSTIHESSPRILTGSVA